MYAKNTLTGTLIGAFIMFSVFGGGMLATPKKAEAIVVTEVGANLVKSTITAAQSVITAGLLSSLELKELTLDGIAWSLAKKVLAQTVRGTIDWINSGFNGKPAFITNYEDYFLQAADEVATEFIAGENFSQLCQPLQLPVRVILDLSYKRARSFQERSQCTISQAVANVGTFAQNTYQDGFRSWFEITSNPYNNVYGASVFSASAMRNEIEARQENARTEAEVGNGLLSMKDCSSGKCLIVTPGNVISEYLNFSLTVGDRVLIEADDINEIVGALFSQLGKQAIAGVGGLLGLSQSQGGAPSYISRMEAEATTTAFRGSSKFLTDAILVEESYAALHEKAIDDLEKVALDAAGLSCAAATLIVEDIVTTAQTYAKAMHTASSTVSILVFMKQSFDQASDETLQIAVIEGFQQLQQDGKLHTTAAISEKTFEIAEVVSKFREEVTAAEDSCN
jgi:hypothetical protein